MNMCHNAVLAEPPEVKVKLAQEMWQALRDGGEVCVCDGCMMYCPAIGVKPSSHIYNILLRVYNDNGHIFKPSEFLEEMQADGVFPNLVGSQEGGREGGREGGCYEVMLL